MSKRSEFNIHCRRSPLDLHHLIFADDLMLFSKGDVHSVVLLRSTLKAFAESSGLEDIQHSFLIMTWYTS